MKIRTTQIQNVYKSPVVDEYPKGFTLVEELFVDNSGFGAPDEMALTRHQMERKLFELLEANNGEVHTYITNVGQFQIYLGVFTKNKEQ